MTNEKNKKWFQYIIFDKVKTYVGSTVNLNRRIRQHNGIIKGGAKYTRGGNWNYYCVMYNIFGNKNSCLSEEWHVKWMSNKVKKSINTYDRRKQALELYYRTRPEMYEYILFVNKKFEQYLPMIDKRTHVFIIDDFTMENIEKYIEKTKNITKYMETFYSRNSSTDGSI